MQCDESTRDQTYSNSKNSGVLDKITTATTTATSTAVTTSKKNIE